MYLAASINVSEEGAESNKVGWRVSGTADCLGHRSSETTVFAIRAGRTNRMVGAMRGAGWGRNVMCRMVECHVCVILLRRAQKEIGMWQADVVHYTRTVIKKHVSFVKLM